MLALQNRSDELVANVTYDGKDEERQPRLMQLKTGLSSEPQAWS